MKNIFLLLLFNLFSYSLLAQTTDLQKGLVAHYPFNKTDNNTKNKGVDFTKDCFGNANQAGDFDGKSYIDLGKLDLKDEFTYAVWYKTTSKKDKNPILSTRHSEDVASLTVFLNKGKIQAALESNTINTEKGTTGTRNDGMWHFFVVTHKGGYFRIYTDGTYLGSIVNSNPITENQSLHAGHHGIWEKSKNGFFDGLLDDIRVYDRVLDRDEVKELFELVENKNTVVSNNNSVSVSNNTTQTNSITTTVEKKTDVQTTKITLDPYYERIIEQADIIIRGRVFDKKQEGLSAATIKYNSQSGTSADLYGKFKLNLKPNTYPMSFSWGGFSVQKNIKIEAGKSYSLLIMLTKNKKKTFSYCNVKENEDEEIELFRRIYSNHNLADIETYFSRYKQPKGRFRITVKSIKNEVEAYQKAIEKKDYEELERFSRTYPKSRYNKDIEKYFAKIKEDIDNGTFTGYAKYVEGDDYYIGEWKEGKPHGKGTSMQDGRKYVGEWKNALKDGRGILYLSNGDKYEGEWKEDEYHGQGTYYYTLGSKYVGNWKKGKKNGKGSYYWTNGEKYIGNWEKGKKNGKGTYHWANGETYYGDWKEGKRHGNGMAAYSNGKKKYDGDYINSKSHGKGKYYRRDGSLWYEGSFVDGKYQGWGIEYDKDGNKKYEGEWKNDEYHGQGTRYYENGRKYVGGWQNGERKGKGTVYAADGSHIITTTY
ncbi:MAG: hypothetical protein COZ18_10060 [Flexibacter sp. CG_4_10_14_3_um_filter_32_15]|nr:MAG: hypothetical protein COZ18_10060 [Flexibacter sp. CG_4_10_14_3_um_filter_32_15]